MATLKDVAKEAGLTVTTVSRVLNNRGYISDDARKRVQEAMEKLHYQPNELARSLSRQTSSRIGVIVPHISHPYFAMMIECLEAEFTARGYQILLHNTNGEKNSFRSLLERCNGSRVDGVVLCSGEVDAIEFTGLQVPVISLERPIDACTASVCCDNYQGGVLAAERLAQAGCRKLVYIGTKTGIDAHMPGDLREDGFRDVCEKKGIECHTVMADYDRFEKMDYMDLLENLIEVHPDIDGIFASSDLIGTYMLMVLHEHRIAVPEQIKVIGFDDVRESRICYPPLTTIHQPIAEMAALTASLLEDAIKGKEVEKMNMLPVSLVERETVSHN